MEGALGTKQSQSVKREPPLKDEKRPLDEGYMKIPPHITDQFGEQFARELYDEKKINKPANTIDVRPLPCYAPFRTSFPSIRASPCHVSELCMSRF